MTVIYGTHLSNDNIFRCVVHFSKILIFWVHRGVKEQKMVQNDKKFCLLRSISQEPCIILLSFMVQMCKMIIFPGVFFNFKILAFWVVRGLKGQKMAQNDKKFCLSHSICQELYIIWYWFLVHMCKMVISPGNFFLNFDFWGFYGGKRAKNDLKLPISVCFTPYLRNCRSSRFW